MDEIAALKAVIKLYEAELAHYQPLAEKEKTEKKLTPWNRNRVESINLILSELKEMYYWRSGQTVYEDGE